MFSFSAATVRYFSSKNSEVPGIAPGIFHHIQKILPPLNPNIIDQIHLSFHQKRNQLQLDVI